MTITIGAERRWHSYGASRGAIGQLEFSLGFIFCPFVLI